MKILCVQDSVRIETEHGDINLIGELQEINIDEGVVLKIANEERVQEIIV